MTHSTEIVIVNTSLEAKKVRGCELLIGDRRLRVTDMNNATGSLTTRYVYEWAWAERLLCFWERRVQWPATDWWRRP